jgi:hypothetical protein
MDISSLPDYATLKKLAAALWQEDDSFYGAAVMVGAGFSRCAASTGDTKRKLPLWKELSEILANEVKSDKHADPLRLAEEYCAYFGRRALLDLVKKEINDAAWSPGELHSSLLELPWSEVLTTNWDTLLERASADVHHPVYSVVSRQEDLPSARSPRIVKLHGTINVTEDLIFTQEDYRRYPQSHAALVNFARQVFIENELCLLGFSGDDPNFLQWIGWVRDHLANHARRIYLVGSLCLTSPKRKYLESINVAPIDLADLVAEYDDHDAKHAAAANIFVQALKNLKPRQAWEWEPTQLHCQTLTGEESTRKYRDADYAANLLEKQLPVLESDRLTYPGWLVCPDSLRWRLQGQLNDPFPTQKNLVAMSPDSRAKLLYEIAWRHEVTNEAIPSWLAQELLTICDPAKPCVISKKQQMEVALLLLKNTRWVDGDEAKSIEQAMTAILECNAKYWPESTNELAYHRATVARDKFDYPTLERETEKIATSDSVWKLRKASLLAELGRFEEGKNLVAEAYRELLGLCRKDRNSIYMLSRLAWAHWLMRGVDLGTPGRKFKAFPSSYQDPKCDPWDHIEQIRHRISKVLEKQRERQGVEPLFEPGSYKDNSGTVAFNSELHPLLLLDGICNIAGMPLRWSGVNFLVEQAAKLVEVEDIDSEHRFALAIRAASSDTSESLKKTFSRTRVACFSHPDVEYLRNCCTEAISYWSSRLTSGNHDRRGYAMERLRVFIEVLARISVRVTPEQAMQVFRFALELGKRPTFHHHLLIDSLRHLIEYALKSIPEPQQHELLLEALCFPLRSEVSVGERPEWPNPIIEFPGSRSQNPALDRRIDEVIDRLAPCSPRSSDALQRLLPLIRNGFLTDEESGKIANKVWGDVPDYQSLPQTGLLTSVLLEIPAQDRAAVRNRVRQYLFEAQDSALFNPSLLTDIGYATQADRVNELPLEIQAVDYFGRLVSWRPPKDSGDPFGFANREEKRVGELIGRVLAYSIVPALPVESLTQANFDKLRSFYVQVDAPATIIALSYFAATDDRFVGDTERCIRLGLQSTNAKMVAFSAHALLRWGELATSSVIDRLTSRLIYLLGSNQRSGLPAVLWTARQMYSKGYFSEDEVESLADSLPVIFDNADYARTSPFSEESVSVSLVREECVRLARDILNCGSTQQGELVRVLDEAKQDALPEVRFAEMTEG